jgi:hypothetical protein
LAICPHISNFRKWIVGSTFVIKKRVFKWGNVLTKLNLPLRLEEYYWKLHISLILFNSVLLLYSCGGLDPILPHWLILDHTGIFAVQPSDLSPPSVFPPDTLNVPDAQTIPSQESPKSHIWGLVVACVVIGLVMFISPS